MGVAYPRSAIGSPVGSATLAQAVVVPDKLPNGLPRPRGSMLPKDRSGGELRHLSAASLAASDRL